MLRGRGLGALIGAIGGLVFVLVNAGGLPSAAALRVAGVVLFAVAVVVALRAPDDGRAPPSRRALRVYGACVVGEVLAIPVGATVLRALDRPALVLPWVVLVLGVHFVPFARAFGEPVFAGLGWLLVALALGGGAVALAGPADAPAWTALAAGLVLLGFSIGGVLATPRRAGREGIRAPGA